MNPSIKWMLKMNFEKLLLQDVSELGISYEMIVIG